MTPRQRFLKQMHYEPVDRSPIMDFGFWSQTIEAWWDQGLPRTVSSKHAGAAASDYFGMDPLPGGIGFDVDLCPRFEQKIIEDLGDEVIEQQADGVRVRRHKHSVSIPSHEGHLLTDRASWEKHYKPRLDPTNPDRIGAQFESNLIKAADPDRAQPMGVHVGSLFGKLRDWMGMEAISYVVYDDPAWFAEMVETMADLAVAKLDRVFARDVTLDVAMFWEDMCYNAGPLLAPEHFKQYLVPQYRRITDRLHAHGVDIVWVDCDGKIDDLIPLWLDAGVNCMFPFEVGSWGADPIEYRRRFGKELLIMGGFDKRILAESPEAITAEVARLTPLVEAGGFIGFCDHRVPPDVPLANYLHYLREVREKWGRGATDLPPLPDSALKPARSPY